jgi:N-carbamoyl-L-amino-acid hydrolase
LTDLDIASPDRRDRFVHWFDGLAAVGRTPTGGWHRLAWTAEDLDARGWFERTAESIGLAVEGDRNGNLWAWWGPAGPGAVVTGSHLDTVPEGGAYDGALGVVCGLLAVDDLRRAHGPGPPPRPVAVVAFADEEGSRFNLPCCGSRLLTGALNPSDVLDRPGADGLTLAEALADFGLRPGELGPDPQRLALVDAFVELHVEQGRALIDEGVAVGIGTAVWNHGRWRATFTGEANHAGTTRLADRRDPMLVLARAVEAARTEAAAARAVATIGRVAVEPNAANAVARRVTATLDARAADDTTLDRLVERWSVATNAAAAAHGVDVEIVCDSRTAGVEFAPALVGRIAGRLAEVGIPAVRLPTAAGHDAGILADHVPAAMLFVRNPTGASHTPAESASVEDCLVGAAALTAVLEDLVW